MRANSVALKRLDAPFGAEVRGFSFSAPTRENAELLNSLLAQHHILTFPDLDKPLTFPQLDEFFRHLGQLSVSTDEVKEHWTRLKAAAKFDPESPAINYVSNVKATNGKSLGLLGDAELDWHNDHAPLMRVKKIGGLQAIDVDSGAPPTQFCDMYGALDTLPRNLRTELEHRSAVHIDFALAAHRDTAGHAAAPSVLHPMIKVHPDSQRQALFVNRSTTDRVIGMDGAQSRQLLEDLFGHAYQERFIYAHEWQKNHFIVWDNIGLQHRRDSPKPDVKRTLLKFAGVAE